MSDEGLIEPDPGLSVVARWRGAVLCTSFLAILGGTGVVDRVWPAPPVTLFGQELIDARAAREQRSLRTGTAARWVEKELELGSRVRRTLAPWWTVFLLNFAEVGSADVLVGDERWLFLRRRVFPPGPYREVVTPGVNSLIAAARRIAPLGTELVVMPVPRKAVVCRELLPDGVDPVPELDSYVLQALRDGGVAVVDLLAAWANVPPREIYLSHDSHWAVGGQLAAARACIAARPEIQGADFEATIKLRRRNAAVTGNLDFVGLYSDHPAYRYAMPEPDDYAVLEPHDLVPRFSRYRGLSDVVLAGSSFTNKFDFPNLLCGLARRDILNASVAGAAFGEPLTRVMLALSRSPMPKTLLYEFPMSYVWDLHLGGGGAPEGIGKLFVFTPMAAMSSLSGAVGEHLWLPGANPYNIRVTHVQGAVLSSGDGVVMVRVVAKDAAGSHWRFRAEGLNFDFEWPLDVTELTLPIVEGTAATGLFELIAMDQAAQSVALECELVTDLDLARSVAATGSSTDGGRARHAFGGDVELGVGAGVIVRLAGDPTHVQRATVQVSNAAGAQRVWTFDARGGSRLVINLGALAAAPIAEVSVECALPVAELVLAPVARAE